MNTEPTPPDPDGGFLLPATLRIPQSRRWWNFRRVPDIEVSTLDLLRNAAAEARGHHDTTD